MALDRKEIVADVDGFYKYWPEGWGCLNAEDLRILADGLDKMNANWQKQLNEYFEEHKDD
jgi:hypothetical protein